MSGGGSKQPKETTQIVKNQNTSLMEGNGLPDLQTRRQQLLQKQQG